MRIINHDLGCSNRLDCQGVTKKKQGVAVEPIKSRAEKKTTTIGATWGKAPSAQALPGDNREVVNLLELCLALN